MKTIIQKPIIHINSEELPDEMKIDILGQDYLNDIPYNKIFEGEASLLNDPIKINVLRGFLDQLEEAGANYVSIDYHTDHRELELDGIFIDVATQKEIDEHNQKDKDFQIKLTKERIKQYSTKLALFEDYLKKLSGN